MFFSWIFCGSIEDIHLHKRDRTVKPITLSFEELFKLEDKGIESSNNPLGLRPDPRDFSLFLRATNRADVSTAFYGRLLEYYRDLEAEKNEADTLK